MAKRLQHDPCQIQTRLGYKKELISQTQVGLLDTRYCHCSQFPIHNSRMLGSRPPTPQDVGITIRENSLGKTGPLLRISLDFVTSFRSWIELVLMSTYWTSDVDVFSGKSWSDICWPQTACGQTAFDDPPWNSLPRPTAVRTEGAAAFELGIYPPTSGSHF